MVEEAIEKTIVTKEGQTVVCTSVGTNENGERVSEFTLTWSFKAK